MKHVPAPNVPSFLMSLYRFEFLWTNTRLCRSLMYMNFISHKNTIPLNYSREPGLDRYDDVYVIFINPIKVDSLTHARARARLLLDQRNYIVTRKKLAGS